MGTLANQLFMSLSSLYWDITCATLLVSHSGYLVAIEFFVFSYKDAILGSVFDNLITSSLFKNASTKLPFKFSGKSPPNTSIAACIFGFCFAAN